MSVKDWSTTAGSNTSVGTVSIAEGCDPGNLNDAIRELMAQIAAAIGSGSGLITGGANQILTVEGTDASFLILRDSGAGANLKSIAFVSDGGGLSFRLLNDDNSTKVEPLDVLADGTILQRPTASVTPPFNGQMAFELTSDTVLKVKVKGSDGVVRSATIPLA